MLRYHQTCYELHSCKAWLMTWCLLNNLAIRCTRVSKAHADLKVENLAIHSAIGVYQYHGEPQIQQKFARQPWNSLDFIEPAEHNYTDPSI